MTELAVLNGPVQGPGRHPFAVEDILADEGGVLRRRGEVLYVHDFRDGYGGWVPIFNAPGTENLRFPLSLASYPAPSMRIGAASPSFGQTPVSTDAILRLGRPRLDDTIMSFSFRYAMFEEVLPSASALSGKAPFKLTFGLDTQDWRQRERQFFRVDLRKPAGPAEDKSIVVVGDSEHFAVVPGSAYALLGGNENKVNLGYVRGTFRYGAHPEYIEVQAGGVTYDTRGLVATITEPLQYDPGPNAWDISFGGGCNPLIIVTPSEASPSTAACGVYIADVLVTFGDELA